MNLPRPDAQVVIIGGGLAGLTLGGLLARAGLECIIVDERESAAVPGAAADPRALAVTIASRCILESLGVWRELPAERVGRIERMQVWEENGQGDIQFDAKDICRQVLGYIIEQSVLQQTMVRALEGLPALRFRRGERPRALHHGTDGIRVELEHHTLTCALVVAADGAASATRGLAGIGHRVHDYHQQALACVVRTAMPHGRVARQRFLTRGPLAFLPMADQHQCGIVWSTTPHHAQRLMDMGAVDFHHSLEQAFEHTLGEIEASGRRAVFPLLRAEAGAYCGERLVLVGDAAHSIHPLAGQGANLGLLDAASLAQVLLDARDRGRDVGTRAVLRRYERWRKGENRLMMLAMDGFKYLFENQAAPLPWLRNAGLDAVDAAAPLKYWLMQRAMGLTGDLPRAARGGSL